MTRNRILIVLGISLIVTLLSTICYAQPEKKAVLVILDGINLDDIKKSQPPNLLSMMDKGGLGLMNVRSGRTGDDASGYLTIGTGAWAIARPGRMQGGLGLRADSFFEGRKVADIYLQQTEKYPRQSSIIVVNTPMIVRENIEGDYGAEPGALAEALGAAGKKVALVGNADTFGQFHREASLIAMDGSGLVEEGEVSKGILREVPEAPFGLETDYEKVFQETTKLLKTNDFVVVETGDVSRINRYTSYLEKGALERARQEALIKADRFLKRLVKEIPKESLIIVVSPNSPPVFDRSVGNLTPVIAISPEIGKGLLTSPTTRQPGLVTNTDIAPTILKYFNVEVPESMTGRPVYAEEAGSSLEYLLKRDRKITETATFRRPILTSYVAAVFVLLVLAALSLMYPVEPKLLKAIYFLLAWQLSVPLSLLLLSRLPTTYLSTTIIMAICISVLITILAWVASRRFLLTTGLIAVSTSVAIILDLLLGAPLMKNSLLGYDPLIGARFYGIGNEYMGVLLGSTLAGATILQDIYFRDSKKARQAMLASFVLLAGLIGYPQLGANIGGAISAAGAFFLAYLKIKEKKVDLKNILLTALVIVFVVFIIIAIDYLTNSSNQSHAGRAMFFIGEEGYKGMLMIVKRKVATNLKLIRWTIWSKVFIASLAIFALLFSRPMGLLKRIIQDHPRSAAGIFGIIAGSIIALLFNDSGIVAAATMIIFGVVPLLYLAAEHD